MKALSLICLACASSLCAAADSLPAMVPASPLAQKGAVILADDFKRADLGPWKPLIPAFTVEGGVLKGVQTRSDHGAVGRFYHPMKDMLVEFKFQLDGSPGLNAVFDDRNSKAPTPGTSAGSPSHRSSCVWPTTRKAS